MGDEKTEWRRLPDWPDYEVSSLGQIRSRRFGAVIGTNLDRNGYPQVGLTNGVAHTTRKVHRCVLEAFRGPRPEGHSCNHLDGNKTNNRLANLEWVTAAENSRHAAATGLVVTAFGENHNQALLNEQCVKVIRHAAARKRHSVRLLARLHGVSEPAARLVVHGKSWGHVTQRADPKCPTVTVRVAVAIGMDGRWHAFGDSEIRETDRTVSRTRAGLGDDSEGERVYWIDAQVPLPQAHLAALLEAP